MNTSKFEIDVLVKTFFNLFITDNDKSVSLNKIFDLCIPEATIIKNADDLPEINSLNTFIEPREKLLNSGELSDFFEEELSEETKIFGKIAQRFSSYRKAGKLNDEPFDVKGWKTFQFIETPEGWRISSVAWDDE